MKKIIFFGLILTLMITLGCDKKSDTDSSKKDDKEQLKDQEPGKEGSAPKIETKSNELGISEGLPADFPKDIPQPKNSKCLGSLNSSEGTVVTFESSEKIKDIIEFYKEELKKSGFEIGEGGETLISDQGGLIGWKKGEREVGLMLAFDKEKNVSSIVLTYK